MGQNRTLATPEAYPAAFLRAVEDGGAVLLAGDLPWTPTSSAKRFRLLLALLRTLPNHPLYRSAQARWHVEFPPRGLIVRRLDRHMTPTGRDARGILAHAIGENPDARPDRLP